MKAIFTSVLLSCVLAGPAERLYAAGAPSKPNFVVILADDMGFSDAGCYGGEIRTPNLDRLAADGLRFTQFYNTARCWPTRACILTGYYAQQVRRDALPDVAGGVTGNRPPWARLLPELLRPLGYRSYHSGKWHIDGPVLAGGFDASYSLNDHDRNFNPRQHTLNDEPLPKVPANSGYYSTTAIAQHAIKMLQGHNREHTAQPFFLYLAFTSPHFPLHALPQDIAVYKDRYQAGWDVLREERFARMTGMGLVHGELPALESKIIPGWNFPERQLREQIGPGEAAWAVPWNTLTDEQKAFQPTKMALHAAMVHRMDSEIGRVLAQIRSMGVLDNTVVLFLSDNSASAEQIIRGDMHDRSATPGSAGTFLCLGPGWSSAANTPFRLHKSWVHEGGICTPFIVSWPKGIRARGELRHNPGHVIDLAPTILELAGGRWPVTSQDSPIPKPPGRSLVPSFKRDGAVEREYLWWYHDGNRAIRVGDWKLVTDHTNAWELYNLRLDRMESKNVAQTHPKKVRELELAWAARAEEFKDPLKAASRNSLAVPGRPQSLAGRRPNIVFDEPQLVNENALGPKVNPFKELYWRQFGGGPAVSSNKQ